MRRMHRQSGLAAVETAIMLPFVALLLFCLVEGGLVLKTYATLSGAAREAARLVVNEGDAGNVPALLRSLTQGLDQDGLNTNVALDDSANRVRVEVSYEYRSMFSAMRSSGGSEPEPLILSTAATMPLP